jgi:L-threonylcarbamoyladenylate synthase
MLTRIIKINPQRPEKDKINEAVKIIKRGGLAVFPTETVYGLGSSALNKKAVAQIFKLKKRERGKPLLILIGEKKDLKKFVKNISPLARKLIRKYWPGPLTLVFLKSKIIPSIVTGGGKKLAIRLSGSKIARELARKSGLPLIGTSANLAGKSDITSPQKVMRQFKNKVDLIIDGGVTSLCLPSTVVDVTGKVPIVLREGAIKIKKLN